MFQWLSNLRHRKLAEMPFPASWEEIVRSNVAHYCMLDTAEQTRLKALIQIFLAEKHGKVAAGLN